MASLEKQLQTQAGRAEQLEQELAASQERASKEVGELRAAGAAARAEAEAQRRDFETERRGFAEAVEAHKVARVGKYGGVWGVGVFCLQRTAWGARSKGQNFDLALIFHHALWDHDKTLERKWFRDCASSNHHFKFAYLLFPLQAEGVLAKRQASAKLIFGFLTARLRRTVAMALGRWKLFSSDAEGAEQRSTLEHTHATELNSLRCVVAPVIGRCFQDLEVSRTPPPKQMTTTVGHVNLHVKFFRRRESDFELRRLNATATQQRLFFEQRIRELTAAAEQMQAALVVVAKPSAASPVFDRATALKRCNFGN